MADYKWMATAAFALEGVVARELKALGAREVTADNGRVYFTGTPADAFRANLWLRCSDRVMLVMGEYTALSFTELFDGARALPWEDILPRDAAFPVRAHCARSRLMSPSDCQKIVKKAVAERLKAAYGGDWLPEDGAEVAIDCAVHADRVTLALDSSGEALNQRGYRTWNGEAPLRETLAAALIQLSPWRPGQTFVDPCCGSGTLLCEAAMIATDRAPGLKREFAIERWGGDFADIRREAQARCDAHAGDALDITGVDIDPEALELARRHVKQCGFDGRVRLINCDMRDYTSPAERGMLIANPPYGERMGGGAQAHAVARALRGVKDRHPDFALGVITPNRDFEKVFGRRADRRRRLYNGRLECEYMLFDRASYAHGRAARTEV